MAFAPADTLFDEITDFLATAPTAEGLIAYRPSEGINARLHDLLDRNRETQLTDTERAELDEFLRMNHFLRMLQLKARQNLKNNS